MTEQKANVLIKDLTKAQDRIKTALDFLRSDASMPGSTLQVTVEAINQAETALVSCKIALRKTYARETRRT